jgi:GTP-binding protein
MVLIDSRHNPQKIDLEFMEWCAEKQVPFVIVFTKIDKLSKKEFKDNIAAYQEELLKKWEELPQCFYTSAEKKLGASELLGLIASSNKLFKK